MTYLVLFQPTINVKIAAKSKMRAFATNRARIQSLVGMRPSARNVSDNAQPESSSIDRFPDCPHHRLENGTLGPGCTPTGEMCHQFCLGGCSHAGDPGACHTCRNVEIAGICATSCPPPLYDHLKRRCITLKQCHNLRPIMSVDAPRGSALWKAFDGECRTDCPSGYEEGL